MTVKEFEIIYPGEASVKVKFLIRVQRQTLRCNTNYIILELIDRI